MNFRFLVLTGLVLAGSLGASDLNVTYGGRISGYNLTAIPITGPGTFSGGGVSVTAGNSPTMSVAVTQSLAYTPTGVNANGSANIAYDFEYFYSGSGTPDGTIPVSFDVALSASDCSGNCGVASAGFTVDGGNAYSEILVCNVGVSTECAASTQATSNHTITLNLSPNTVHTAVVSAGITGFGPASAYADPYMFIDPSFANASQYQLLLPAGVGNTDPSQAGAAAPEPATFGLVGLALAGAGIWRRRRSII